jgi:queuine tRNA-ribosyltransferase
MIRHVVTHRCGEARVGILHTRRGSVATPCFMAVGTQGALKGITVAQARSVGQEVLLANTYHLALRPGAATVAALGGLHRFTGWPGPMLTDSGGYQVFSLATQRRIDEAGVHFRSHLDGRPLDLTPEESLRVQRLLGADIIMALDICPAATAGPDDQAAAVDRTHRWLARSIAAWEDRTGDLPGGRGEQALFGIVQGGTDPDLRRRSLAGSLVHDLPGWAIGGLAVGESAAARDAVLAAVVPSLPADRPRYLMGVGTPRDLVDAVARGVDLFDCVLPTRMGRHGVAYTDAGPLHLTREEYARDAGELDPTTPSPASGFARGYLRHLLKAGELLGGILVSLHNLAYYQGLLRRMRSAIAADRFPGFATAFREGYAVAADGRATMGTEPRDDSRIEAPRPLDPAALTQETNAVALKGSWLPS